MAHWPGLPLEAVARQLGATPASIKQRLYRARRHLQKEALAMARQQRSTLPDDFAAHVIAHLLKSGRDDRLHMRYEAAKGHFNEVLDLEPGHPTARLEWGRTYDPFHWPDGDQVGALERAARVAPDSLEVLSELEVAYRQPGFEAAGEKLHYSVGLNVLGVQGTIGLPRTSGTNRTAALRSGPAKAARRAGRPGPPLV